MSPVIRDRMSLRRCRNCAVRLPRMNSTKGFTAQLFGRPGRSGIRWHRHGSPVQEVRITQLSAARVTASHDSFRYNQERAQCANYHFR